MGFLISENVPRTSSRSSHKANQSAFSPQLSLYPNHFVVDRYYAPLLPSPISCEAVRLLRSRDNDPTGTTLIIWVERRCPPRAQSGTQGQRDRGSSETMKGWYVKRSFDVLSHLPHILSHSVLYLGPAGREVIVVSNVNVVAILPISYVRCSRAHFTEKGGSQVASGRK